MLQNKSIGKLKILVIKQDERTDDIVCNKCRRNCKIRAALCAAKCHWILYHCERLSPGEIRKIEFTPDFCYTCRSCKNTRTHTTPSPSQKRNTVIALFRALCAKLFQRGRQIF